MEYETNTSFQCPCGTRIDGLTQDQTLEFAADHACPGEDDETPWYEWVFSFWGWAITGTVALTVSFAVHPDLWNK